MGKHLCPAIYSRHRKIIFQASSTATMPLRKIPSKVDPLRRICSRFIGADISRLNDIRKMGTPFASIGGAGSKIGHPHRLFVALGRTLALDKGESKLLRFIR